MRTGSFPGVKSGRGVTLTLHPLPSAVVMKEQGYTSTLPMGRTACTEPQCLYLFLFFQPTFKPFHQPKTILPLPIRTTALFLKLSAGNTVGVRISKSVLQHWTDIRTRE